MSKQNYAEETDTNTLAKANPVKLYLRELAKAGITNQIEVNAAMRERDEYRRELCGLCYSELGEYFRKGLNTELINTELNITNVLNYAYQSMCKLEQLPELELILDDQGIYLPKIEYKDIWNKDKNQGLNLLKYLKAGISILETLEEVEKIEQDKEGWTQEHADYFKKVKYKILEKLHLKDSFYNGLVEQLRKEFGNYVNNVEEGENQEYGNREGEHNNEDIGREVIQFDTEYKTRLLSRCERLIEGISRSIRKVADKHLLYAYTIVKEEKYSGWMDIRDLSQVAYEGLIKAGERYVPSTTFTFMTHSKLWIIDELENAITKTGFVFKLGHISFGKFTGSRERLYQKKGLDQNRLNDDELATYCGISKEQVRKIRQSIGILSLDQLIGKSQTSRINLIEQETFPDIEEAVFESERLVPSEMLEMMLEYLPEKEIQILKRRYGIENDGKPETLKEIANEMNISQERVRQLEVKAMQTLRTNPKAAKMFAIYMGKK